MVLTSIAKVSQGLDLEYLLNFFPFVQDVMLNPEPVTDPDFRTSLD